MSTRGTPPHRRHAAAVLAALALGTGPGCFAFPFRASEDPERPTITRFDIQGASAVDADDLLLRLATQASARRYLVLRDEQYFDPDAFANDKQRILRYYQAHGYYRALIESAEVIPDGKGRVRIQLKVSEGAPVRVARLEIEGLEKLPDARARLQKFPLKEGDAFTEAAYDAGRTALLAALGATGWAKAEVTQHAEVDPSRSEARVRYTVVPGERYRFGTTFIAGAAVIPRARIREEAEHVVTPGAIYDATSLPKVQARVFDLGVFGGVRVSPGPDDAKRTINTVVSVREAPFRTVRAGPGVGVQLNRYDASLLAGWQHRNWLGGLRRLSLDARVGWAFIRGQNKDGFAGLFTADLLQPGVIRRLVDLNLHAELEWGIEPFYDFRAERGRVGLPLRVGRLFTFTPSLNVEVYHLSGQPKLADPQSGQVLTFQTCPGSDPNLCLLSYLEQRLALDFRDDPISTTKGLYLGVALQEGFSFAGNGSSYLRLLPEVRAFASLPAGIVVAARARIGIVNPLAGRNVPIVAKFTSGGPNGMRGYYSRQLSPVLASNGTFLPVGGNGLLDGSVELRFPIYGSLGGATFLDFGNVDTVVARALNVANLQYAAGLGIRYKTLFGPVRLDAAFRLPRPGGEIPGVQIVGISDPNAGVGVYRDQPRFLVHFTIGEAF